MIGNLAIGPRCARKAGIVPDRMPKNTGIKFLKHKPARKPSDNLDLFYDLQEIEP